MARRETLAPKRLEIAGERIELHNEVLRVLFFKGNVPIVSRFMNLLTMHLCF